jgi:hypothetical protein
MAHLYFSQRNALNPNPNGLPLADVIALFQRVYDEMVLDGYFTEALGYHCVDAGFVPGSIHDVDLALLLEVRKKDLWPIQIFSASYSEDDFFDVIEFLCQHVSKPTKGTRHDYGDCGMHWEIFNGYQGREHFRLKVNAVLSHYERKFELAKTGEILHKPESGFENLMETEVPAKDSNVTDRVASAALRYRRHGATVDDRRQAVRDLADVLEYLKPEIKKHLTSADEKDLFNIANNFGVRHHNDKQKTGYDAGLWLSWMFYFFLATIHVVVRKMGEAN